MAIKLVMEDQILDENYRREVIQEILGPENVARRKADQRKYEVYRDKTKKWVMEALSREGLSKETLQQMMNRASNISICRKVVNKLAQSYVHGVIRKFESESDQEKGELLTVELDVNSKLKKTDQYIQLFKNTMIQVVPERDSRQSMENGPKFKLKLRTMPPWMYNVIEDSSDNEVPRVVILDDFNERSQTFDYLLPGDRDGRGSVSPNLKLQAGDGKDQIIADTPTDKNADKRRQFIWWSDRYHFTTDQDGKVISALSPEDGLNPIQILPFVNFAEDQDGSFWAEGGDDLIDGSILINKNLTDTNSIAYQQGWGQLVITGKDVPKVVELGPHKVLVINQESNDEPTPQVFYASAAPNLDAWMRMIEQQTALVLSTNNLSPTNVAGKLDAADFPSGIAMLIENAQSTANMQDRQKLFKDQEPLLWEVVRRWYNILFEKQALTSDLMAIGPMDSSGVKLHFQSPAPVVTEKEKVEILKARKELGLDTIVDLIIRDNPDISHDDAEKKALELTEEKLKRAKMFLSKSEGDSKEGSEEESEEEESAEVNGEQES